MHGRLLLVLALALTLRIVFFALTLQNSLIVTSSPDSGRYLTTAASLANDHTFSTAGRPETRQTPGYPFFLVLCGVRDRGSYHLAQIVQIVLDVFLVYLTFRISASLFGPRAAIWSALFQAVSALAIFSSVAILTDSLFALLVAMIVWLYVFRIDQGFRYVVAAGLLTAAATWVRPVGFFLLPAEILVLSLMPRRMARAGTFALVFVLGVAPWYARNESLLGYAGFSSRSEQNLLYYEAAGVLAANTGVSPAQARTKLRKQYQSEASQAGIQPDTAKASALQRSIALPILRASPAKFVIIHLKDSLVTLFPASPEFLEALGITKGGSGTLSVIQKEGLAASARHYFRKNLLVGLLMAPELLLMACCYGGFIVWAWAEFSKRIAMRPPILLLALLIPTFIFVGGAGSVPRYRLPVEALINCAAGAGIARLLERRATSR